MANYSLVVDSKFRPFSFDEYVKPYAMYGEAYHAREEALTQLAEKADLLEELANSDIDRNSDAYRTYKSYSDALSRQAEDLASRGLSLATRKGLINLRREFSKKISPIGKAYAKRAEDAKLQRENEAKGIIYNTRAADTSIDDYLSNPNITFESADVKEGYKRLGDAASALAKKLSSYGVGKNIDPYTKTFLQEHGYKEGEVFQAINDIKNALNGEDNVRGNGILQSLLNQEMAVSGASNWSNKAAALDYFNRVSPALYQSVGQTQVSTMDDYANRLMAKSGSGGSGSLSGGLSELRHWGEGIIGNPKMDAIRGIRDKIINKGRRFFYIGNNGSSVKNPMEIYEEVQAYAKEHPEKLRVTSPIIGARDRYEDISMSEASSKIREKYGVEGILSEAEYNTLKEMGYSSNSPIEDFTFANINPHLESSALANSPTSINLSKYDKVSRDIKDTVKYWENNDKEGLAYSIENGKKGKMVSYKDIFGKDGKKDVSDIAYSLEFPEYLLVRVDGNAFLIDPTAISEDAARTIRAHASRAKYANDNETKGGLQDITAYDIRQLLNNYGQVRTETSSKI